MGDIGRQANPGIGGIDMFKTVAKLLIVVLALSASPLDASSVLSPASRYGAIAVSVTEALAALPAPMSEEAFFEILNAGSPHGYVVGGAQGSQFMVVILSFTVPSAGDDPSAGIAYNEKADKQSWHTLQEFLEEIFKLPFRNVG